MTDSNPLNDPTGTPEDVATLYSWANLHGAKYRDFSASRAQTREKTRLRAEQALEDQRRQAEEAAAKAQASEQAEQDRRMAEEAQAAEQARQAETAAHQAEIAAQEAARQQELAARQAAEEATRIEAEHAAREAAEAAARQASELAAQQAAKQAAEQAAKQAAEQVAELAAQHAAEQAREQAAQLAAQQIAQRAAQQAAQQAAEYAAQEAARHTAQQIAQQRAWQQPPAAPVPPPAAPYYPQQPRYDHPAYVQPQAYYPAPEQRMVPPHYATPAPQEVPARNPWAAAEVREPAGRPAWLSTEPEDAPAAYAPQAPVQPAPEDTLQGSRDRLTSRWFALRGIFEGGVPPTEAVPAPAVSRAPALAIFSLAGGVGKTSLAANLGRALSARSERVLLVDTAAFGLMPFFFGATDQRPGQLRTFAPPGASTDAPIQMVTLDPDGINSEIPGQESLSGEISKFARGASRILVDLATASGATTRRILRMSPTVLVPVVPDMNSVVSVSSIDAFFEHNSNPAGKPSMPYYVMNQFDASLPLHLDVREVLREQLGERLLPFALRRTPAMSEALAEGMTVIDYAPSSPLAEDFATLAGWVKSISAPATTSYRGVRWSER